MVKRSTINMNFLSIFDYMFINHIKQGDSYGPQGTSFATTIDPWNKYLDANGYPNNSAHDNHTWAVGVRIPASTDFAGPYVLTWDGNGEVFLSSNGSWAIDAGQSSNYTAVNSARWHGTGSRIVVNFTGARELFSVRVMRTNRDASGNFLKNLRFYRLADEADLLAGKVFRSGAKQILADLNPGAIRFMNWTGHNTCQSVRFEHRLLPSYACYGNDGSGTRGTNWVASPPYPESTGTNTIAVASATGMPVAMQHGEVVTCRMGNATARNGSRTVTSISKANPGVVVATGHGFNTGDVIVHTITAGMTQLHNRPCTVTVSDANTYSLGIDTSAYTTFTTGTAKQYITLNVGARGAYPVLFGTGTEHASNYGDGYIAQYDYKTFVFDKDMVASTAVTGAWIFNNSGAANGHESNPPLEICTALINELMAMTRSDGGTVGPIDMWVTFPHRGMLSVDPDYSAGSNWATGMVGVIINGANGYSGLDSRCDLIIEFSNETWNSAGGGAFDTRPYLRRQSEIRWGTADQDGYHALRTAIMVNDIKAAFPRVSYPRIKYVTCGQGTIGLATDTNNDWRVNGNSRYDSDAWNIWGGNPIDHCDYFGVASYFETSDAYKTAHDATDAAAWVAAVGAVAKEAACQACVDGLKTAGGNETIDRYGLTLLPLYANAMGALGKKYVMYEGGWNDAVSGASTDVNNYKIAVKQSAAWAQALRSFFDLYDANANALYPADYIITNSRWGHCSPDSYSGTVEGAGLDLAYTYMSLRNRGLSRLRAKN